MLKRGWMSLSPTKSDKISCSIQLCILKIFRQTEKLIKMKESKRERKSGLFILVILIVVIALSSQVLR